MSDSYSQGWNALVLGIFNLTIYINNSEKNPL